MALATATSGIAATLLPHGRTVHQRFKVPIDINSTSMCSIRERSAAAELVRRCKLLIIDEVTMAHRHVYETLDRSFQSLRKNDKPFGAMTVVFSGDWCQILPVVKRGSPADIMYASLKQSYLWSKVIQLELTQNMRIINGDEAYASFIRDVGEGKMEYVGELGPNKMKIPDEIVAEPNDLQGLCDFVYEDIENNWQDEKWLCSRAILCPKNTAATEVNEKMIKSIPNQKKTYKSADKLIDQDRAFEFPVEFLNKFETSGKYLNLIFDYYTSN